MGLSYARFESSLISDGINVAELGVLSPEYIYLANNTSVLRQLPSDSTQKFVFKIQIKYGSTEPI